MSEASLATLSTLPAAVESPGTIGSDLTQSFINYYDPALVSHISGWPAEQLELRVCRPTACTTRKIFNIIFFCSYLDFFNHYFFVIIVKCD